MEGSSTATILGLLSAFEPADADERASLEATRRFVRSNPTCLERSTAEGHLTASAWVVDRARRRVLLVHHRKLARWLQPGGHADGNPDLEAVARREVFEETGLGALSGLVDGIFDVDVHAIPAGSGEPAHLHYDVRFLFEGDPRRPLSHGHEVLAVGWVELGRLAELGADRSVLRMAAKTPRR